MTFQTESPLDATDWNILRELQADARLSYNELGRRVALSAPAAAERVRKLEDRGIITGYGAQLDPAKVGLPIIAFIQMRCDPDTCLIKTSSPDAFPEVVEMHRLSGNFCSMLKVHVASMVHLEALNERLVKHGNYTINIVTSSPMPHRPLDWEDPSVSLTPTDAAHWGTD